MGRLISFFGGVVAATTLPASSTSFRIFQRTSELAYDALGDFETAVKELKLACALDCSDPGYYYSLYALYKRKSMHPEQRQVLLDALDIDPLTP